MEGLARGRIVAALAALSIALGGVGLAGCGDDDQEEVQEQLDQAQEEANEELEEAQKEAEEAQEQIESSDLQQQLEDAYEKGEKKAP